MESFTTSTPINLKRKTEEIASYEDGKRARAEPRGEECESINNNYKSAVAGDEDPSGAVTEEVGEETFGSDPGERDGGAEGSRLEMYHKYQPWLLKTYGELKKTKTITVKKYERVVRTLRGLIPNVAANSKFRFWIRTKGFCLGPPDSSGQQDLFVASPRANGETVYKRVAVVERFFDIIYSIHVELEGRGGRHAGQKKTYRAITESYAFLPREAVTKFLLGCVECQRRSDVDLSTSDKSKASSTPTQTPTLTPKHDTTPTHTHTHTHAHAATDSPSPCDQTVPSSSSSEPSGRDSPLHRQSSDESRSTSSCPADQIKLENTDSLDDTPKCPPLPINLTLIRRRIPLNLPNFDVKYDKAISVIKKSGFPESSPNISNIEPSMHLNTPNSTPNSSHRSASSSDTTISKSSESDISPIEPEYFQKPYPKRLYTIHPHTFETIRIPLKHEEISIYYDKNKPYIKPKRRFDSDPPPDTPAPILSTYLRYMRNLGYPDEESLNLDPEAEIRTTPEPELDDHYQGRNGDLRLESPGEDAGIWPYHGALGSKKPTPPTPRDIPSPATLQETGSVHDETSSSGNKEDEDDDEEEIDDLKTIPHDPERLKAFNMFVRLFVDENLDRIVPISKQPKEKIQAIIDSCTRQFPEFAERARKRIRTYLKSCRRNKRTRDSAWPESNRPTPAHLTSVQAEQILAQACENESHNAKRMRLGLDPVSQPMPVIPGSETPPSRPAHESFSAANLASSAASSDSKPQHPLHLNNNKPDSPNLAKVSEPPPAPAISSISSSPLNGAATSTAPTPLYRPNFTQAFQRAAGPQPTFPTTHLFPTPPFGAPGLMHNGPTDLSMKPSKPLLSHKLNPTEMAAVRQLITGYRESAAFLLRSAEELEQLLLQQP